MLPVYTRIMNITCSLSFKMHFIKKIIQTFTFVSLLRISYSVVCQDIYKSSTFLSPLFNFFVSCPRFLYPLLDFKFTSSPVRYIALKNHQDLRKTLKPSIIRHEINLRNPRSISKKVINKRGEEIRSKTET